MRWSDLEPGDVYAHWETSEATLVVDKRSERRVTAFGDVLVDKQVRILRLHVGQTLWMYVSDTRMEPNVYEVIKRREPG